MAEAALRYLLAFTGEGWIWRRREGAPPRVVQHSALQQDERVRRRPERVGQEGPSPPHWVGFQWSRARSSEVRVRAPPRLLAGSSGNHLTSVCLFPTCMGEATEKVAVKMKVLINTCAVPGGGEWVWSQNPGGPGRQTVRHPYETAFHKDPCAGGPGLCLESPHPYST